MYVKGIARGVSWFFGILLLLICLDAIIGFAYSLVAKISIIYAFRSGLIITGIIVLVLALFAGLGSSPSTKFFRVSIYRRRTSYNEYTHRDFERAGESRFILTLWLAATGFILFYAGLSIK